VKYGRDAGEAEMRVNRGVVWEGGWSRGGCRAGKETGREGEGVREDTRGRRQCGGSVSTVRERQ